MPQSGSDDDDETWLTGTSGCKTTTSIKVAAEAISAAEECWVHDSDAKDPFHHLSKTQPVAEPDLPRITAPVVTTTSAAPCSTIGHGSDLPGPLSQDDDEDSSPLIQELDRAEHTQCSSNYLTLTHSLGASAHGSEKSPRVTPASPPANAKLTNSTEEREEENAKLT